MLLWKRIIGLFAFFFQQTHTLIIVRYVETNVLSFRNVFKIAKVMKTRISQCKFMMVFTSCLELCK